MKQAYLLCFVGILLVASVSAARESVNISTTSDLLELNESIGDVRETITEVELLKTLQGGIITTNRGTTEFNQYLRFRELNGAQDTLLLNPRVLFRANDAPWKEVGDWLFISEGSRVTDAFFEYEEEFETGLASMIVNDTLVDYANKVMTILGRKYVMVKGKKQGTRLSLDLIGGYVTGVLNLNETRRFILGNSPYSVRLLAVYPDFRASFMIDNEITPPMSSGDVYFYGAAAIPVYLSVTDIVYSPTGGYAHVYLGRDRVELTDRDYTDSTGGPDLGFTNAGVMVNNEQIEDAWVYLHATLVDNVFKLWSFKYRLLADALPGSRDIYARPGETVRQLLDEPEGMIGGNWDIKYNGLEFSGALEPGRGFEGVTLVKVDPAPENDKYLMEFENNLGSVYRFPFISNEAGVFKFGDNDDDLVLVEGNFTEGLSLDKQAFNVGVLDYFALTDSSDYYDDTAVSRIVRYNSIDSSDRQVQFDDVATGSIKFIYEPVNIPGVIGRFVMNFTNTSSERYVVYIANATTSGPSGGNDNPLVIDQNGDGRIERDRVQLTTNRGGIIEPVIAIGGKIITKNLNATDGGSITVDQHRTGGTWTNRGSRLNSIPDATNITLSLITLSEDFDENTPASLQGQPAFANTNEVTNWTIEKRPNNQLGLSIPSFWSNSGFQWWQGDENDDNFYEMNDYGVYFNLFKPEGTNNSETLTVEYPLSQRGAGVAVIGANLPPALEFIGNKIINEGQPLMIQLNATDPDNDPIIYSTNAASVLPSQFAFSNTTGLFRWTPTFRDAGNYVATFSASDGELNANETITIAVNNYVPQPAVIGAPTIGNTISIFISDQEAPNQFYIIGMSLSNTTGIPLGDGRTFPLDFDYALLLSLYNPTSLGLRNAVGVLNPLGNGVATWAIPNVPELAGSKVYIAFITLNTNLPLPQGILGISSATEVTVLP